MLKARCLLFLAPLSAWTLPGHNTPRTRRCEQPGLRRGDDNRYLSMRAEVEAPFRTFRMFILAFFVISASVASLVATSQLVGSLGHAPNAKPLEDVLQTWGIDVGCVVVLGLLLRKDWGDRAKQILRMGREETLASCQLELASGKTLQLGRLRGFCRPVIFAGSPAQIAAARAAAEPYKAALLTRGVFLLPLPLTDDAEQDAAAPDAAGGAQPVDADAQKWMGKPIRAEEWRRWFKDQAGVANASLENGLYVGLRLDGRVRASGTGMPPWGLFAAQIAPMEGMWKGMFDGMDGRVGE